MATSTCATASVAFLPLPTTIAALAAALAAAHLSVVAAVGRGASPRPRQRLRMLLLSSLLSSSCFPIPFLPLLLSYPTGCGTISSIFVNAFGSRSSQLRQQCMRAVPQHHARSRSSGPCCGGPVGGFFASGLFLLKVIGREKVRPRALEPMLSHTDASSFGAPTTRVRVLVCLHFAAAHRKRRGAEKVPKSRVALKRSFRIAAVA